MVPEAVRAAMPAARLRSAEQIRAWRESAPYRAMATAFAGCPADDAEPATLAAEALLGQSGWAAGLVAPLVSALAADPLFEPPFRAQREDGRITLTLFGCAAATIIAQVVPQQAREAAPGTIPGTMRVAGRMAVVHYVRARGVLRRWRAPLAGSGCTALAPIALADGTTLRLDGRTIGHAVTDASGPLVTLTAVIHAGAAALAREYRIADGVQLCAASADEGASRCELLLAFLRAAGRTDAGTAFADATRDPAFQLRWAAIREWLALDAAAALPRLRAMAAEDPAAEIRAAAAETLARIALRLTELPCPA